MVLVRSYEVLKQKSVPCDQGNMRDYDSMTLIGLSVEFSFAVDRICDKGDPSILVCKSFINDGSCFS